MMRLIWRSFVHWLEENHVEDLEKLNHTIQAVHKLCNDTCVATYDAAVKDESCNRILQIFSAYLKVLKTDKGPLAAFWMTYVEIIEILLGLLRADREGDWQLHLACIRKMIPWCFAMDKTNYARYLPVYYAQMCQLQKTSPELYAHFVGGGFSVQLSSFNPFGRIAVDQTTEETVNKDTQTAGGTCGFSLKPGTVARYYLTAEHRAMALRQLREHVSARCGGLSHTDLQHSRIKRDESDVTSMVDLLENSWSNPFHQDPSDLINLSTGAVATPEISNDIFKAQEKGEEAYQNFRVQRLEKGEGFYDTLKKQAENVFFSE